MEQRCSDPSPSVGFNHFDIFEKPGGYIRQWAKDKVSNLDNAGTENVAPLIGRDKETVVAIVGWVVDPPDCIRTKSGNL